MSNYIVEDEMNDYYIPRQNVSRQKRVTKKPNYMVIGVAILIVMIIIIIVAGRSKAMDKYSSLEKEMIIKSKDYVNNNSIPLGKEIYINALNISLNIVIDSSSLNFFGL